MWARSVPNRNCNSRHSHRSHLFSIFPPFTRNYEDESCAWFQLLECIVYEYQVKQYETQTGAVSSCTGTLHTLSAWTQAPTWKSAISLIRFQNTSRRSRRRELDNRKMLIYDHVFVHRLKLLFSHEFIASVVFRLYVNVNILMEITVLAQLHSEGSEREREKGDRSQNQ